MIPLPDQWRQVVAFLFAGGLNTCFGYLAFAFFLWIGGSNDAAVVLGTVAGVIFNFATYRAVFAAQGHGRLPHFVIFYALLLAANILLLRWFTEQGVNPYASQAVIILLITPLSFFTMRNWVFPEPLEAVQ